MERRVQKKMLSFLFVDKRKLFAMKLSLDKREGSKRANIPHK